MADLPGSDNIEVLKRAYQFARIAVGVAGVAAPGAAAKLLGVESNAETAVLTRLFGVRDAVIGLGQVMGERHDAARGWYEAAAVVDAADGLILISAATTGSLPRGRATLWASVGLISAGLGIFLARTGDDSEDESGALREG